MAETAKIWTILDILNWSNDYLEKKGVDDARNIVEWLLCDVLACSRMQLYLQFDRPLEEQELAKFRPMLQLCAAHKPLEQVLGTSEFYGIKLKVNEHVLIPRPETERLVETAIDKSKDLLTKIKSEISIDSPDTADRDENDTEYVPEPILKILDIGAGSGCISIALAKYIPQAHITAVEKSVEAVKILQQNIQRHNLENRIQAVQADIFTWQTEEKFHIVVSNPPYISQEEIPSLEKNVAYYEPAMALSDNEDGLSFYRLFAEKLNNILSADGFAAFEYGGNHQSAALKSIFREYSTEIIKDYQQDDRVMIVKTGEKNV